MNWLEVRDKTRLWCKIDPRRCLIEIVHRGIIKYIDLTAYGLAYVGRDSKGQKPEPDREVPDNTE